MTHLPFCPHILNTREECEIFFAKNMPVSEVSHGRWL